MTKRDVVWIAVLMLVVSLAVATTAFASSRSIVLQPGDQVLVQCEPIPTHAPPEPTPCSGHGCAPNGHPPDTGQHR